MSLFMPREEGLPTQLGALVPRPAAPLAPEWKRIGVDLYAHRDTGMLKFTPPVPAKEEVSVKSKPTADLAPETWRANKPPSTGWWECSNAQVDGMYRYWNGSYWSKRARRSSTEEQRDEARAQIADKQHEMEWRNTPPPPWGRE